MTDLEKIKEYLFNTANLPEENKKFFISADYLIQTIAFLKTLETK